MSHWSAQLEDDVWVVRDTDGLADLVPGSPWRPREHESQGAAEARADELNGPDMVMTLPSGRQFTLDWKVRPRT